MIVFKRYLIVKKKKPKGIENLPIHQDILIIATICSLIITEFQKSSQE